MGGKSLSKVIAANAAVVILLLLGTELLLRRQIIRTTDFQSGEYRFDRRLGWAPESGIYSRPYGSVTVSPEGFRQCPGRLPPSSRVDIESEKIGRVKILACGDSFTFGWAVSDYETWPCRLEQVTGYHVVNAGASGYGVDQMILRLEEVIGRVAPDLVIIALIMDDVRRCGYSIFSGRHKPYYEILDGHPVLDNSPVPPPYSAVKPNPRWYERIALFTQLASLFRGEEGMCRAVAHNRGMEVARHLLLRARELAESNRARLLVVIMPEFPDLEIDRGMSRDLEHFLDSEDIPVLNLYPLLERAFPEKSSRRLLYCDEERHFIGPGYRWVATEIAGFIVERKLLSEAPAIR